MWSRVELKEYAKSFLKRNYWKAFIVVLIVTILSGGAGDGGASNQPSNQYKDDYVFSEEYNLPETYNNPSFIFDIASRTTNMPFSALGVGFISIATMVIMLLFITVGLVAEVGQSRFFLDGFEGDVSIKKVVSGFNREEYIPIVKTQIVKNVYIFLWSLLFIVPGIIKAYEYYYVPYIIAEQPHLSPNEAISKSRAMTMGHKLDMFVLNMSFILWYMAGSLLFGIGIFFVNPYKEAVFARLYNILSDQVNMQYQYSEYGTHM